MSDARHRTAGSSEASDTLAGGGEMGALMRSTDWSTTRLGPLEQWPQSLRTTVSTCLNSRFPILIWWGPELAMLYNDAYKQILGTKHPASLGARGQEVWPEIWDVIGPMLDSVRRDGKGTWSENQKLFLNRFGFVEETYFTFSYSPIRDESGGAGGVFSAISETTGQVLSERRLRALRDLAALTTGARSTEEACRLAARAIDGYGDDVPFALLYTVEDQGPRLVGSAGAHAAALAGSSWQPQLDEVLKTQRPELVGWLQPRPDAGPARSGPPAPERALILPIGLPGEPRPVAVMIAGLSVRLAFDDRYRSFLELMAGTLASAAASARALQESKRRAEALAELDRAKTAFFSNVSHEFRTPLTLMLGPTEDLLSGTHGELAPPQRAQLELLRRNELRLQRLVNALLEFSRIESGRAKATFEETDLCALTRDLASAFRSAVERAGLAFAVDCALDEPAWVDRDLWEQIVLNLLSNALKFTFEGRIELSLRPAGDRVLLQVKDTGVGIRAEDLPRLFERFHRVEGTRARTHEGSGIGLALVQELVKLHGGAVGVQSAQGAGTTFTVEIPRGNRHLPPDQLGRREGRERGAGIAAAFVEEALRWMPEDEGPLQNAREGPARVVVADDNADMRAYLRRILSARWEVELVPDGKAALAAVRRRRPDLVLTDVMMPELDGFGLLRELRADPATATVPVMMVSARAGEESRVEGLEAGADDYLVKPFSARELLARASTQIRLARAQSALEHQWEEIHDVLRLLPVAIAVVALPEERYEFVNDAYEELMGRNPVGRTMDEAWSDLPPQALERLRELRRQVLGSEQPVLLPEVPRTLPSGAQRHYTVSMRVWADAVGRRRLISSAVDVTDQVVARLHIEQSRDQIARSEHALRKAMTLRDDFLTMASHELRTPLTTLGLEAEGLRRSIEQAPRADPLLERWAQRAGRLAGQAARLEQLIEGMVDLAGLSGELSPGREEELDLSDLARSVVERFREGSKQARSSITLLAEPVCGRWERRRVERILTQLVANALKFGANNPIDVAVGPAGERARIAIKDRGIGIQPEDQERIFGRFERAAPPEHYGGFGVGLWMVGELVKSMSGSVRVDSRPGEGATFVIELPRRP